MEPLASNHSGRALEAGCDEAGRGCLAGPVFAAAVIFPKGYSNPTIQDSKALNKADRMQLAEIIRAEALHWAVASCSASEIDKWNILQSSVRAMHRALRQLAEAPEHILVDGNYFKPFKKIPHDCIVKGDSKYLSIAAASILAKVARDIYMQRIAKKFPRYSWEVNKGYPTLAHRAAIAEIGATKHHRMTFQLLKKIEE